MADPTKISFYKSAGIGLGGEGNGVKITSGTRNNLFTNVNRSDQVAGVTHYLCMYLVNETEEEIKNLTVWL